MEASFESSELVIKPSGATLTDLESKQILESVNEALKGRTCSICLRVSDLQTSVRNKGFKVIDCGNGDLTFSLSQSSKGKTLASFCEKKGLDINEVFKIGDQPQEGGNDHDFLNTPGSFTCGSANTKSVFPCSLGQLENNSARGTPVTFEILNKVLTKIIF